MSLEFCDKCYNLMYYKLDENKPVAICASCGNKTRISNPVIHSKEFNQQMNLKTPLTNFTIYDKALQRTHLHCPQCKRHTEFCLFKKDRNGRLGQMCTECKTIVSLSAV